jgi:hypothetical protein
MRTLKDFSFYLDAWNYCRINKIDIAFIQKKDFRNWNVVGVFE